MKKREVNSSPNISELEQELGREKQKQKFRKAVRSTLYTLVVTAAVAVLVATVLLPVMRIYGNSMTPTLTAKALLTVLQRSIVASTLPAL